MPDATPCSLRNATLNTRREALIRDIRALADMLEANCRAAIPTPEVYVSIYSVAEPTSDNPYAVRPVDVGDVRLAMRYAPGHWRKHAAEDHLSYVKDIGDTIRMRFEVDRSTLCRRIQTGTRRVEATEAHDEPIYEWVCDGSEPEVTNG